MKNAFNLKDTCPPKSPANGDLKKLSVQLPRQVHQDLKMLAIRNETSITDLMLQLIADLLKQGRHN